MCSLSCLRKKLWQEKSFDSRSEIFYWLCVFNCTVHWNWLPFWQKSQLRNSQFNTILFCNSEYAEWPEKKLIIPISQESVANFTKEKLQHQKSRSGIQCFLFLLSFDLSILIFELTFGARLRRHPFHIYSNVHFLSSNSNILLLLPSPLVPPADIESSHLIFCLIRLAHLKQHRKTYRTSAAGPRIR